MAFPQKRSSSFLSDSLVAFSRYPAMTAFAGAAALMAATAIANRHFAKKAQRDNPPRGRFIDVDGVHLHYVERGNGRPAAGSLSRQWQHDPGLRVERSDRAKAISQIASDNDRLLVRHRDFTRQLLAPCIDPQHHDNDRAYKRATRQQ